MAIRCRTKSVITAVALISFGVGLLLLLPLLQHLSHAGGVQGLRPDRPAPEFRLRNAHDQWVDLEALRQRPTFISFGYRSCGDTCPAQWLLFQQLHRRIGDAANYVWISLEPEYDRTLAGLAQPLGMHSLQELFPASRDAADRLLYRFLGHASRGPGVGVAHSSFVYLLDTQGRIRLLFQGAQVSADSILADAQRLNIIRDQGDRS